MRRFVGTMLSGAALVWSLMLVGCLPDLDNLTDRRCDSDGDCDSDQCLDGFCTLEDRDPEPEPTSCDIEVDRGCVCTLDEDGTKVDDCIDDVTDDGEACTCTLRDGEPDPEPEPEPEPEPMIFRFVLVEDLTANPSGDLPGADVDAISVVKADGNEFFAAAFEADTNIDCTGNLACDASNLLGAPDAVDAGGTCFGGGAPDTSLFTSLNGGFVIVSFGSVDNGDVTIENGDDIHVYEVGATECGRFEDDPFRVFVSVADDVTGDFRELGEGGDGSNIIPVSGL